MLRGGYDHESNGEQEIVNERKELRRLQRSYLSMKSVTFGSILRPEYVWRKLSLRVRTLISYPSQALPLPLVESKWKKGAFRLWGHWLSQER
jgi:hypothetical protein